MQSKLKEALDSLARLEDMEREMLAKIEQIQDESVSNIEKIVGFLEENRQLQYKAMREIDRLSEDSGSATRH